MRSQLPLLFFFTALFVIPHAAWGIPSDALQQKAKQLKLAEDPQWLRLLHYRKGIFGKAKSDIDGPNFFLAKDGRKNPEAELEATLNSFFEPMPVSTDTQHPQCRYPARYSWLNEKLHFGDDMPKVLCERYDSWVEKINPASISLVFSGYYLNNPASMYGHTFLRVGRKDADPAHEKPLIDYTINFAAQTATNNGIAFAVMGLLGGYPGTFSAVPYYMKVQKYNNLESRDLWEYKLNLSSAAVERLIQHLWELGPTSMSYYFFNRNCSYQLLPFLEVGEPSFDLSSKFQFRAIPVDTLRAVIDEPGILGKRVLRPSALRRMTTERDNLTKPERHLAAQFATAKVDDIAMEQSLGKLPVERQRLVLNAASDYLRYRVGYARQQPADVQEREQRIFLALSKLPTPSDNEQIKIPEPAAPETSHPTGRLGYSFGSTRDTGIEELTFRGALHDFEANQNGYVDGSELEMMALRLRWENKRNIGYVEEATGISVRSMTPWEEWVHKQSWRLAIQYTRAHDLDKNAEGAGNFSINGGSGISIPLPILKGGFIYGLIEGDAAAGATFDDGYRLGAGPSGGIVLGLMPCWRVHFNAAYIRYGTGNISSANKLRLIQAWPIAKRSEVRLTLERQNHYLEGRFSLNHYF